MLTCCRAKKVLLEATQIVTRDLDLLNNPLELHFSGLGNFSKNVLFVKIAEGESKKRLTDMAGWCPPLRVFFCGWVGGGSTVNINVLSLCTHASQTL